MDSPPNADNFATIRARMEELGQEREGAAGAERPKPSEEIPVCAGRSARVAIAVSRSGSAAG